MIKKLHLKNFKSHRDTLLEIKPLTVISGVNNIGKSSVLQSLLLLRQSFNKKRLTAGLDLNMPLVSIGIGNDALYRLAQEPILSIGITTDDMELDFNFDVGKALTESFIPIAEDCKMRIKSESVDALFKDNFQYLSANRWAGRSDYPKASYEVNTEKQISLNNGQGELLGNFLYTYQSQPTYNYTGFGDENKSISLLDQVNIWENEISRGITINVQPNPDNTGYKVIYGTEGKGLQKSIEGLRAENVGFGVSYSISIVTALLSAEPGALIMIENPEAHLHPEGQAKLAELICLVAQRGVQVIVETHSDHIINGVLVNCKRFEKEGRGIDRENVSMYYFNGQDENHAVLYDEIKILSEGEIEYQPKGFFDRIESDREYLIGD